MEGKIIYWCDASEITFEDFKKVHEGYFENEAQAKAKYKELGGKVIDKKKTDKEGGE